MEKIMIPILEAESEKIETLFNKYNSYLRVIAFLIKNTELNENNNSFLHEKFEECINISMELEAEKERLNVKYNPDRNKYNNYTFDFVKQQLIFED